MNLLDKKTTYIWSVSSQMLKFTINQSVIEILYEILKKTWVLRRISLSDTNQNAKRNVELPEYT